LLLYLFISLYCCALPISILLLFYLLFPFTSDIRICFSPYCDISGEDLAERGAQETSSVVVETVQKVAKSKQVGPVLPLFKSDASKVTSKGMGLKKAYLQKQNMFTVHAGDAGRLTSTYYIVGFFL
jgi:hypothetical protein